MNCSHYIRKCKLLAPCCNKEYPCRICHDEQEESHSLDRQSVESIICTSCDKKQGIDRNCNECGILFGRYSCTICRLFDDKDKKQFHCDGCGVCRVGGRENFIHCPVCNICISKTISDSHKCLEDISRRKCPVCLEDMHSSRKPVDIPPCSHMIHKECLNEMLRFGNASCPICNQSVVDLSAYWEKIDDEIANTEMPEIYRNWKVNILCRDCHNESKVPFHIIGFKCSACGGYNTTRIGGDDPLPEEPIEVVENVRAESDSGESWETLSTAEVEFLLSEDADGNSDSNALPEGEIEYPNSNEVFHGDSETVDLNVSALGFETVNLSDVDNQSANLYSGAHETNLNAADDGQTTSLNFREIEIVTLYDVDSETRNINAADDGTLDLNGEDCPITNLDDVE